MAKYLNPELTSRSFKRLSSRKRIGKTPKERTSVLMFFLSIDAACKHFAVEGLDLNPDSLEGKNNRKQVELEFTKLVLVENDNSTFKQVAELGKIDVGGANPEKRISSNFFTVPLKKASGQTEPYYYPRRPSAPLLKMGLAATQKKWGVEFHDNWSSNFPVLLSEVKDPTPFLDLAIFVCRDCKWDDETVDVILAINEQIRKRFTRKLSEYWTSRLEKEKIMAHHLDTPFIDHHSLFVNSFIEDVPDGNKIYTQMNKTELINRIYVLEEILSEYRIKY